MPAETRVLFDLALIVFILVCVAYAVFGPSGPGRY